MIGVINNSPQQINAALIAMKNELKREIITETKIEQYVSDVIDDTITSTSKTWSSEKITSEMYPLGFIYMQLYNPTSASWEKSPIQLGMTPASGCKWEEITSDFASYPYLKIGSGTTQNGQVLNHTHGMKNHTHSGTTGAERYLSGYQWGNWGPAYLSEVNNGQGISRVDGRAPFAYAYSDGYGHGHDFKTGGPSDNTTDGNNTSNTTNEVNASNMKIWKVIADV